MKMTTASRISSAVAALACWVVSLHVHAATIQTAGAGSTVASVDLSAAFDALDASTVVHLDNFAEGALKVTTSADSWAADFAMARLLDPFYGANGADRTFYAISSGNNDWVTIQTTNRAPIVYDTIAGCQYRMVHAEALPAPAWNPVTPPLPGGWKAGGGTLTFTDPGAVGHPRRFYRVEVR